MEKEYHTPCAKFINVETCDIIAASTGNQSKRRSYTDSGNERNTGRKWNSLWEE